uniref:Uncharacterized protein n=2 Tax=Clastoptera arizonana TaxID=38151 RepID=A0A1B6DI91_9HEMI
MADLTAWKIRNEFDITELKRKLLEICHELQQKKSTIEILQKRLAAERTEKLNLQIDLDTAKTESKDNKFQIEATTNAFKLCEEKLKSSLATSIRDKLQMEATLKINDTLREQAGAMQAEITTLQNKVEDLERQLRLNMSSKDLSSAKQFKTHALLETLMTQIQSLEKDRQSSEKLTAFAIELGKRNKVLFEQSAVILKENEVQKDLLSKQVVALSSENDLLKEQVRLAQQSTPNTSEKSEDMMDIMKEWQNSVKEMKERAIEEAKETERLQSTLKNVVAEHFHLQNLESSDHKRIRELETILEEEKDQAKKPPSENIYQQTDKLEVVEIGCGSEAKPLHNNESQTDLLYHCTVEIQTDLDQGSINLPNYENKMVLSEYNPDSPPEKMVVSESGHSETDIDFYDMPTQKRM